jgi:hypothetical protein
LYVNGWFAGGNTWSLCLQLGDERIQAFTGFSRPDVASAHAGDPKFWNSGFLIRFKRPPPGAAVTLKAVAEDGAEIVLVDGIALPEFDAASIELNEPQPPWPYQPLISVLLDVPESHSYFVTRCIESILQQRYQNWELCLTLGEHAPKITDEDSRLRVATPVSAQGEFVVRIDYQDELHPLALIELVNTLNAEDRPDLVYSDSDEIDLYGNSLRRFFKPDFNAEALLSWNFVGRMAAWRRGLPAHGDTDWDTLLRVLETGSHRVAHIKKPLYHFRQREQPSNLPHAAAAIRRHIERTGKSAVVEPGFFPGSFRLKYPKQASWRIAVFVRAEDGAFQHAALKPQIDQQTTQVYELLGNGADLLSGPAQHSRSTIRDLSEIAADVFVFINRPLDTVNHFFFEELTAQAMRADCGLVIGISLDRTGRKLHRSSHASNQLDQVVHSVDAIPDDFFATKRSHLLALGGFEAIVSTHMPRLVASLIDSARAGNYRILVTPYSVATFDLNSEEPMPPPSVDLAKQDVPDAAQSERDLAVAQLREIASERNHLRRELALLEASMASLKAGTPIAALEVQVRTLNQQVQELTNALEAERTISKNLQDSISWKLTTPLRAWKRLVRRES